MQARVAVRRAQGVVNRDIKLENTLLDQSRRPLIKICDFGYSKHLQKDSVPKSRVGTPGYTGARPGAPAGAAGSATRLARWEAGVALSLACGACCFCACYAELCVQT